METLCQGKLWLARILVTTGDGVSLQILSAERGSVLSKVHQEPRRHILEVEYFSNPFFLSLTNMQFQGIGLSI